MTLSDDQKELILYLVGCFRALGNARDTHLSDRRACHFAIARIEEWTK